MARSKSQSESSTAEGQPANLEKIDAVIRQAYEQVKSNLDEVTARLSDLESQRKSLAERARQLEFALGIGDADEADTATPAAASTTTSTAKAAAAQEQEDEEPAPSTRGKRGGARTSKRGKAGSTRGKKRGAAASDSGASTSGRKRSRGGLWNDVQDVMKGKGKMQASKVIEALVAKKDYEDTEKVRTRVYNSLGRWAREGKLSKSARGVYSI